MKVLLEEKMTYKFYLIQKVFTLTDKEYYYFGNLPENYLQWKRVDVYAKQDCCDKRRMTVYLAEEGNLKSTS
jgi:hypothetical protein